jgi:hypothetical protein
MKLDMDPFPVGMVELELKKILVCKDQAETAKGKNVIVLDDLLNWTIKPHNPEVGVCHARFLCQKPNTHRMHDPRSIIPHIRPKAFTDNQISRIKYNYYINNVSKDYDDSHVKRNSGRLHSSTGMATGATHSLELLIIEFQSIFSF